MRQQFILQYDHTFEGFLTAVFQTFYSKYEQAFITPVDAAQNILFAEQIEIVTDSQRADRVWKGIQSKISARGCNQLYYAFLSEEKGIENILLKYIQHIFASDQNVDTDYANAYVLHVVQTAKMVSREKHRMEAFIRFRLTKDNMYVATIEPDFNVLPLIRKHFKSRYADQQWLIYDLKRKYGLYYDLNKVETIEFDINAQFDPLKTSKLFFDESEIAFQELWQNYFNSANIPSRKNMKLHIRHVPKRYWKYLSEKIPQLPHKN